MITIVAIIALSIIAVLIIARLIVYGWWKTNDRIAYEVQRRLQNYDYFCEKYNNLKCDVERINDLLNSANDRIKILTNRYDCEVDDIKGKIEALEIARKAYVKDLIQTKKDLKELIDARYDYLRDRLLTHCHAYNVENNTLYIQNPLWIDNTKEPKAIEKNEEG